MRFLERLLPKMYIALIPHADGHWVYGELRKEGRVIKRFTEEEVTDKTLLAEKVKRLSRESAQSYVVLLDSVSEQGVLPSCGEIEGLETSSIERVCLGSWALFMDKDDLFARQRSYKEVGLDLLFSPYSLLRHFFAEQIKVQDGLYLLIAEGWLVTLVIKENRALFGELIALEELSVLADQTKQTERYVTKVQESVKRFYEEKSDETMFIEHLYIADAVGFDIGLENRLEELLFVDIVKQHIELSHELVSLAEKEFE